MRILSQTALLASAVALLTFMASSASCQDGLQNAGAPPAPLQAVPESSGDTASGTNEWSDSSCGSCDQQGGGSCGPSAIYGRPRAFVGRSHGCACGNCGPQGPLAHLGSGISHLGSLSPSGPLVDPWARADWIASQRAATQSWHAGYYHTGWGAPVALVVPPTARMQTRMGWGVSQTTVTPIYHQFERPYPGGQTAEGMALPGNCLPLRPTPRWPSHTDQFGVYYVRGPW